MRHIKGTSKLQQIPKPAARSWKPGLTRPVTVSTPTSMPSMTKMLRIEADVAPMARMTPISARGSVATSLAAPQRGPAPRLALHGAVGERHFTFSAQKESLDRSVAVKCRSHAWPQANREWWLGQRRRAEKISRRERRAAEDGERKQEAGIRRPAEGMAEKFEIRSTKSETNPKHEIQMIKTGDVR